MKYRFGFNTVPIALLLALACAPAWAGCSVEQTASNEITIRTSVGGCDGSALREGLSAAVAAGDAQAAQATPRESAFSGIKRSSGQSALWRLANMNQPGPTSLTMPGMR